MNFMELYIVTSEYRRGNNGGKNKKNRRTILTIC
jgi:hypothetical protein